MSPCVVTTPTMSAENGRRHNVTDIVTGFKTGSRVGWRVAARLPSHIHDSSGHYSNGGNGRILRKKLFVYVNYHIRHLFCDFLAPNHTITVRFSAKPCRFFFMSKRISRHVVPTWHVMSSDMVRTTEFDDVLGRNSQHFPDMSACRRMTCRLGGSGNTTRRWHFQPRAPSCALK